MYIYSGSHWVRTTFFSFLDTCICICVWQSLTKSEQCCPPLSIPACASVCGSHWIRTMLFFSIPECASVCGSHWIRTMLFSLIDTCMCICVRQSLNQNNAVLFHTRMCICVRQSLNQNNAVLFHTRMCICVWQSLNQNNAVLFHIRMCICVWQSLNQNNAVLPFRYLHVHLWIRTMLLSLFSIPVSASVCGNNWIRRMLFSLFDTRMQSLKSKQCWSFWIPVCASVCHWISSRFSIPVWTTCGYNVIRGVLWYSRFTNITVAWDGRCRGSVFRSDNKVTDLCESHLKSNSFPSSGSSSKL